MKRILIFAASLLLWALCGVSAAAQDENLKIKFLGTGAADWVKPRPDGEFRRNASILVDDSVLVDLTYSTLDMIPEGVHPEVIFYTHSHGDHFQPEAALKLGIKKAYVGATWVERARKNIEDASQKLGLPMPQIVPLNLQDKATESGITFTALPANHGTQMGNEQCLIYLLEKNGTRVLYATDTGGLMADAAQPIGIDIHNWTPNPIHGLIMECTVGWDEEDYRLFCHSNIHTVVRTHNVLTKTKRYLPAPGQPVYLTHIGEELHGSQAEMDAYLPSFLKAPVDGDVVVFNHNHVKNK